jgi:hypothetical protein
LSLGETVPVDVQEGTGQQTLINLEPVVHVEPLSHIIDRQYIPNFAVVQHVYSIELISKHTAVDPTRDNKDVDWGECGLTHWRRYPSRRKKQACILTAALVRVQVSREWLKKKFTPLCYDHKKLSHHCKTTSQRQFLYF